MSETIKKARAVIVSLGLSLVLSGAPVAAKQGALKDSGAANKPGSLHRLDFRVEGASCPSCLMRTGRELRDVKGVIKADVSIYRPYWAIVIYDAGQTNLDKMKEAIKSEHVKLAEVEDKSILEVPLIVIPKTSPSPVSAAQQPLPDAGAAH